MASDPGTAAIRIVLDTSDLADQLHQLAQLIADGRAPLRQPPLPNVADRTLRLQIRDDAANVASASGRVLEVFDAETGRVLGRLLYSECVIVEHALQGECVAKVRLAARIPAS